MFEEEVERTALEYGAIVGVTIESMHRNVLRMTVELEGIVKGTENEAFDGVYGDGGAL